MFGDTEQRIFFASHFIVAGIVAGLAVSDAAPASTVRTVAVRGQPATGTPEGVSFIAFNRWAPVLNDAGQVAFSAILTGSGVNTANDQGIWLETSGSLALVTRSGSHAPDVPNDTNYSGFNPPVLDNGGRIAFLAGLTTGNEGIWSEGSGGLSLVALSGSHAPGTPSDVNYSEFGGVPPLLNNAGQTAFRALLAGSGVDDMSNEGIWSEGSGNLALVARTGSHAPGTPDGVNYSHLASPVLNDLGQIAFGASLTGEGINTSNNVGIWSEGSGSVALVARTGSQAPGAPKGVNFSGVGPPALNNAGQIAFLGRLTDFTQGIWFQSSGSLSPIVRSDSPAPGTPDSVNFDGFSSPVLNNAGQIAFRAFLAGSGVVSGAEGIWSEGSGSLALVARSATHAPGTPDGVNFSYFLSPVLNDAGQTAFLAFLTGSGVEPNYDRGIWATDRIGALQLIARTSELLEVAPGDFRVIEDLEFFGDTGNSDGRQSGFNKRGQLAFWAQFTDGSQGIFVSNLVAIPEPSPLILAGIALLALAHVPRCVTPAAGTFAQRSARCGGRA